MAGNKNDTDLSTVAWPGFVDILSAVVIMFVFFLLVVATALYFHIIIYKSQILANPENYTVKVDSDDDPIVEQIDAEFSEAKEQRISFLKEEKVIIIFFGRDSISVRPETLEEVKKAIPEYVDNDFTGYNVRIIASKNPTAYENTSRKVALSRMLNVRNIILQTDLPAEAVDPKIVNAEPIEDSYHWVKLVFEKK